MHWIHQKETFFCSKVEAATELEKGINKVNSEYKYSTINVRELWRLNSSDVREFLCGWGSAVMNVTITYPVNKVIFRQILEDVPTKTAIQQLSQEGIRLLYRGILPPLCQKTLSLSLMFSIYEGCCRRLNVLTDHKIFVKIFAANFAGTCEAILMPFERVQTLLQDWRYHQRFRNMPHAFYSICRDFGVAECYRGLLPIIYRNGFSNLVYFSLKEQSIELLGNDRSLFSSFISGAFIGGCTSSIFYPVNVIKVHMQSKVGGEFENFIKCVRDVYVARNRSVKSFYKGVHLNFLRSFISWGVVGASYDTLKKLLS